MTGVLFQSCILVVCLVVYRLLLRRSIPRGLRLPPGPPRKLIVGNVFDMPTQQLWVTFSQWARAYGDLVYLNLLGQSIVIISSAHVAYELFEKRSSIYSDRFRFPVASKLMGLDWIVTFMPYGDKWRRHRRVIHQKFHPAAAAEYQPVQLRHTRELLRRLYETPDLVTEHARHTAGAIIMEVVYGSMLPRQDLYIATAEKTTSLLSAALTGFPGLFLVDMIPILKYVEWFPGAGFQKKARLLRKVASEMNEAPFEAVKQALNSGVAESSFTSSLLEEIKGDAPPEQEDIIRAAGSTCFGGGTDTTLAALRTFFLAMLLFPEAQRKAQEELDGVVGSSRLPEYEDRKSLPYIDALCKEILRWHPSFPIGAAHRVTQDDVFDGYFIPAGTIVIGNTWHILHDETKYGVDTDKFQPERFLDPDLKDPNIAFGYGRRPRDRICPGRYFAQSTIYIAVASILSVFDITPSKDSSGRDIPAQAAFEPGFMSPPMAFKCNISPRSNAAKRLILQEEKSLSIMHGYP